MDIKLLQNIIKQGLSFQDYCILKIIQDNALYLFKGEFSNELISLLSRGLVTIEGSLTLKGEKLIKEAEKKEKGYNYVELHKRLQDKLIKLTGKKQKTINGKYAFLPNAIDLEERLSKIIIKYGLKDMQRMEKVLDWHIENSHKKNWDKVMLISYFISKDSNSQLVTIYENWENKKVEAKVEPKEIKNLF